MNTDARISMTDFRILDLKALKAGDGLCIKNINTGAVQASCEVTKAGAAHLLVSTPDTGDLKFARATGAQVPKGPWVINNVWGDVGGDLHDARHSVTDVLVTEDMQAQAVAAFGPGVVVRVQVILREGVPQSSVARVWQGSYTEDFTGDANADALFARIIEDRKATGEAPGDAPVGDRLPAAPTVYTDPQAKPAAVVLTAADTTLCTRVARTNVDLRKQSEVLDLTPFTPGYFAATRSLVKAAGGDNARLAALCDAAAAAANTLLADAAPAPVVAPAPVPEAPAAPVVPHGVRALAEGRSLRQTHAADDATAGRTVDFDTYLAACDAVPAPVAAPAPATPVQAPAAPAPAVEATEPPGTLEGCAALARTVEAKARAVDGRFYMDGTLGQLTALRVALEALAAAPEGPVQARAPRAVRRAEAPTDRPPVTPRKAPVPVTASPEGMAPTWPRFAGLIGRHAAKFIGGTGPVTADDVAAAEHPYVARTPVGVRDWVLTEAARIATAMRTGAAPASKAPAAPKAPRKAPAGKAPAITVGGKVRISDAARPSYKDVVTAAEVVAVFTVTKVSGARVFAQGPDGASLRFPLADLTAC